MCPSFDVTLKNCVDQCEYGKKSHLCYALNNPRTMIYNKKKLENNERLLNSGNFVSVLKKEILMSNSRKIRFFSSGDMNTIEHLEKIYKLTGDMPKIQFWLSTFRDSILYEFFKNDLLPHDNLNIILSNKIPNTNPPDFLLNWCHSKNIRMSSTTNEISLSNCHASINRTSCDLCENCFNGIDIKYYLHGKYKDMRLNRYEAKKNESV